MSSSSDIPATRQSARQAAKTSFTSQPSLKRPAVHPPPAKKRRGPCGNNKKNKRASTGSVANLPPRLNHPPGPPRPYDRRKSAPPALEELESTHEDSSTLEEEATDVKVEFLDSEVGQKLSAQEIFAYADAVAYKRSIGSILTDPASGRVIVDPIQGSDKPVGSSLNDACAWTSFALSDAELFGQDTDSMIHDSGNKKSNDRQKIGAFARFIRSIHDHEQLSPLARLIVDPEGGKVMRFILLLRGSSTNVKMHLLNTLMLAWSYDFHMPKVSKDSAKSTYQPNYTDKVVRQIFKCFHDAGIMMNHADFRGFVGSYWAYFKGRFAIAVQVRSDFGRNPFRAAVEYDDEIKMRTNANPPLQVLSSYDDNLLVALYKVARDFMNRGGCEVCLLLLLFVHAT
jgi:hypothetical protein